MNRNDLSRMSAPINRRTFVAAAAGTMALAVVPGQARSQAADKPFRIAMLSFSNEQLDPAKELRPAVCDIQLLMYDFLLEIGKNSELEPGLAQSWTVDPNGLVWTFKLREGVQFHGGYGELTAEDAVYSLNRWLDPETSNTSNPTAVALVESVAVVDKYTFSITTKGPQPGLLYLLSPHQENAGIVWSKKHLIEKGGETHAGQNQALNEHPIGSGPYEFVSRQRGQSITFAAIDNHWRVKPFIRRVEFLLIPEASTQLAMLQAGEVDLISLDPDRAAQIQGSSEFEVRSVPETVSYSICCSGTWKDAAKPKPTSNVLVRQALSKAIDRKTIIAALMGGYGSVPAAPFALLKSSDGIDPAAYSEWSKELSEYDPEGAKKLLAEAGFPEGFSGIKLYIFNRPGGLPNSQDVSLAIAAQWEQIGVKVEPAIVDYAEFRPHWTVAQDDPYIAGELNAYDTPHRFTSEGTLTSFFDYSAKIVQLLKNEELDATIAEIRQAIDDKKRTELVSKAFAYINDQWVTMPVVTGDTLFGVSKASAGKWTARPAWAYLGRTIESIEAPV